MTIRNRDELPDVPEALLKRLETTIPHKCPDISTPDRQIWFYSGQRNVVDTLRSWFNARYNPQKDDE